MIPDGAGVAGTVSAKWAKGSGGPAGDECYNLVADVAPTLTANGNGTGGNRFPGTNVDDAVGGALVVATLRAGGGGGGGGVRPPGLAADQESQLVTAFDCKAGGNTGFGIGDQAGALRGAGHGGGHAAIAFTSKDHGQDAAVDQSPTLRAMQGKHQNGGGQVAVVVAVDIRNGTEGDVAQTVQAGGAGAERGASPHSVPHVMGFQTSQSGVRSADAHATLDSNNGSRRRNGVAIFKPSHFTRGKDGAPDDLSPPLSAEADKGDQDPVLMTGTAVRRLTPRECERLQAFPDDHTLIPVRRVSPENQERARAAMLAGDDAWRDVDGEMWIMAADGSRYKALGNAMNVNEVGWVLRRIELFEATVGQEES